MTALPKLVPSRMTIEEFLDWPGDGCRLRAVYEGTRFYRGNAS